MSHVRSTATALLTTGLLATVACTGDRVTGATSPAAVQIAPSIAGVSLNAGVLAQMRRDAWGCVFVQAAGSGHQVLALSYHRVPFDLPRQALPSSSGPPAKTLNELRRLDYGGQPVFISCAVPQNMTYAQFRFLINASAGPRWEPIRRRLNAQPIQALSQRRPLPPEAIQVRYELLGEDAGPGSTGSLVLSASVDVGGALPTGGTALLTGGSVTSRIIPPSQVAATCTYGGEPSEPPIEPLIAPPLPWPPPPPPPPPPTTTTTHANRVSASYTADPCGSPMPSAPAGSAGGGYDSYGGYQDGSYGGSGGGGSPLATGGGTYGGGGDGGGETGGSTSGIPCYRDCATAPPPPEEAFPPPVIFEGECPADDPDCFKPLTASDSAIIHRVKRHARPEWAFQTPAAAQTCAAIMARLDFLMSDPMGWVFRGRSNGSAGHWAEVNGGTGMMHIDPKTLEAAKSNRPYYGPVFGERPPSATDVWEKLLLSILLHEAVHTVSQADPKKHPLYDEALQRYQRAFEQWKMNGEIGSPPTEPRHTESPFHLTNGVNSQDSCVAW